MITFNQIEIKKIILSGLQTSGYPLHKGLDAILQELISFHTKDLKTASIRTASQYIFAYLQLGGSYMEHQELFDHILNCAGYSEQNISTFRKSNTPIIINHTKIRSLLGRWPASPYNSHTIMNAVNEILRHCLQHEYGVYQYYTKKKDGVCTALYQLTISDDYIIFHDVFQNRYYTLIEK